LLEFGGILRPVWCKLSPSNPNNVVIWPPNSNNLAAGGRRCGGGFGRQTPTTSDPGQSLGERQARGRTDKGHTLPQWPGRHLDGLEPQLSIGPIV